MEVSLEMVEMVVICSGIRLHVSTHGSVTVISQRTRERENEMMGGRGGVESKLESKNRKLSLS